MKKAIPLNPETVLREMEKIGMEGISFIFYELLKKRKIDFHQLLSSYFHFVQEQSRERLEWLTDAVFLVHILEDPTIRKYQNADRKRKKSLKERIEKLYLKTGVFKGTEYEKELLKKHNSQ